MSSSSSPNDQCKWFIIIPVFNPPATFPKYLEQLEHVCPGALAHLLLIDDGSTNGMPTEVCSRFPQIERIQGDGNLWWGGGIRLGMETALAQGAKVVVWLNHDCLPDKGTLPALVVKASEPGIGAASAWCYCKDHPEYPVNPGFRKLIELPGEELKENPQVVADGTNGNCVAISMDAVRAAGLPRVHRHPHYGDGPYTYRLHQAGFTTVVLTRFRAALEREFERCIDEASHSALWNVPFSSKLRYYLFSMRSKYHWKNKFWDAVAFRGFALGIPAYFASQFKLIGKVASGHLRGCVHPHDELIESIMAQYSNDFPPDELRKSLQKLASATRR